MQKIFTVPTARSETEAGESIRSATVLDIPPDSDLYLSIYLSMQGRSQRKTERGRGVAVNRLGGKYIIARVRARLVCIWVVLNNPPKKMLY